MAKKTNKKATKKAGKKSNGNGYHKMGNGMMMKDKEMKKMMK